MNEKILITISIVVAITISFINLALNRLPNSFEVFPVDDGSVIQLKNEEKPIIHYSVFNIRNIDGFKEPIISAGGYNMLKDIRYPVFPSFIDTYNIIKNFNNTENNIEIHMTTKPSQITNQVTVTEIIKETSKREYLYGIELFVDNKIINTSSDSQIEFEYNDCQVKITTSGILQKDIKIGENTLWFKTNNGGIKFNNQIDCKKQVK